MVLRRILLAVCAALSCAAAEPPAALQPYVADGRFEPGDYGWLKGRFADASSEDRETYRAINDWYFNCWTEARAELQAELSAAGYPDAEADRVPLSPRQCLHFRQPNLTDATSFAAFQRELAAAKPIADTYLVAVALAEESTRPFRSADLARLLETHPIGEQMLRRAWFWGQGMPAGTPALSPTGQAIVQSQLSAATGLRDHANTEWLKGVIDEQGWPTISQVGGEASNNAWLMVQHADHDPLFQLRALRLMEPLVAEGEVSKPNYAYLYDRVMLKLAGKQRYGTQVMCQDGVRGPLPLEDEANVDRLRLEMGLPTLAEYIKVFSIPCEVLPENSIRR